MEKDTNSLFLTKNGKKYVAIAIAATIGILGICGLVAYMAPDWDDMCTESIEDRGYKVVTLSCLANVNGDSAVCSGVFHDSEYRTHAFTIDFRKINGDWKAVNVNISGDRA